jgi:RNA polymerase primary sigma factor
MNAPFSEETASLAKQLRKHFRSMSSVTLPEALEAMERILGTRVQAKDAIQYLRDIGCTLADHGATDKPKTHAEQGEECGRGTRAPDITDLNAILEMNIEKVSSEASRQSQTGAPSYFDNQRLLSLYHATRDTKTRDAIVEANLPLVKEIAKRYEGQSWHDFSFDDLVSEGTIGLMKAIDRFNPAMGTRFSTYATYWVAQAIRRATINRGTRVRIPVHMFDLIMSIRRAEGLALFSDRVVSVEDICNELRITCEQYESARLAEHQFLNLASLHLPVQSVDDGSELVDFIGNEALELIGSSNSEYLDPARTVEQHLLDEELNRILGTLTSRQQEVLRLRFGLGGGQAHTLDEVGRIMGVTRERIRQIEEKALRRLRHPSRSRILRTYLMCS